MVFATRAKSFLRYGRDCERWVRRRPLTLVDHEIPIAKEPDGLILYLLKDAKTES